MNSLQIKRFLLSTSLFLTLIFSAFGQLSPLQVDSLVTDAMDKFNVAGVAVAIV
ncbi:MAG TPA: serine hydrolase, partial [Xanthomarina gelatinilytica]|nr:serine hydrolase [Xanthomarina gelatinilytica]